MTTRSERETFDRRQAIVQSDAWERARDAVRIARAEVALAQQAVWEGVWSVYDGPPYGAQEDVFDEIDGYLSDIEDEVGHFLGLTNEQLAEPAPTTQTHGSLP